MCSNTKCSRRFKCYRYIARPNSPWQSYGEFPDKNCMDYEKAIPIIKYNNGRGAILCNHCGVIIKEDLTKLEFKRKTPLVICDKCKNELG